MGTASDEGSSADIGSNVLETCMAEARDGASGAESIHVPESAKEMDVRANRMRRMATSASKRVSSPSESCGSEVVIVRRSAEPTAGAAALMNAEMNVRDLAVDRGSDKRDRAWRSAVTAVAGTLFSLHDITPAHLLDSSLSSHPDVPLRHIVGILGIKPISSAPSGPSDRRTSGFRSHTLRNSFRARWARSAMHNSEWSSSETGRTLAAVKRGVLARHLLTPRPEF